MERRARLESEAGPEGDQEDSDPGHIQADHSPSGRGVPGLRRIRRILRMRERRMADLDYKRNLLTGFRKVFESSPYAKVDGQILALLSVHDVSYNSSDPSQDEIALEFQLLDGTEEVRWLTMEDLQEFRRMNVMDVVLELCPDPV